MYTLVFIILIEVTGLDKVTALQKYQTKDECMSERTRILIEMEKAYPGDTTWTLECRMTGQRI